MQPNITGWRRYFLVETPIVLYLLALAMAGDWNYIFHSILKIIKGQFSFRQISFSQVVLRRIL